MGTKFEKELLERLFECLDVTSLNVCDSERSVGEFVGRVARLGVEFPELPTPASVCVWPVFVDVAGVALGASRIAVASVAGGFPSSQTFIEVKMLEAAMAVESGADEIDVVIEVGEVIDGQLDKAASTLALLREEVGEDTVLKVIIESGMLPADRVRDAAMVAMRAGADFVKTSTGKTAVGATVQAVESICGAIGEYYAESGRRVGVKVAGGVRTVEDAVEYWRIVERTLGPEWLNPRLFRIGASSLANHLIGAIVGREVNFL